MFPAPRAALAAWMCVLVREWLVQRQRGRIGALYADPGASLRQGVDLHSRVAALRDGCRLRRQRRPSRRQRAVPRRLHNGHDPTQTANHRPIHSEGGAPGGSNRVPDSGAAPEWAQYLSLGVPPFLPRGQHRAQRRAVQPRHPSLGEHAVQGLLTGLWRFRLDGLPEGAPLRTELGPRDALAQTTDPLVARDAAGLLELGCRGTHPVEVALQIRAHAQRGARHERPRDHHLSYLRASA